MARNTTDQTEASATPPSQKPPSHKTGGGLAGIFRRLYRALGPIAGAVIIDLVDLVTFGPLGIVLGPILGTLVGWWVSGFYRFSKRGRLVVAAVAGIYCTIPFTELIPVATIVSAIGRFWEPLPEETGDKPSPNAGN